MAPVSLSPPDPLLCSAGCTATADAAQWGVSRLLGMGLGPPLTSHEVGRGGGHHRTGSAKLTTTLPRSPGMKSVSTALEG